METLYTAVVTSVGGRTGHVKSPDGNIDLEIRPPKSMGGPDGKYTNPEQLFAAGYAACFSSAFVHAALEKKLRIKPVVTAHVNMGKRPDGTGFMLEVQMDIVLPKMDEEQAKQLVEEAHTICPYSYSIKNNVKVTSNISYE